MFFWYCVDSMNARKVFDLLTAGILLGGVLYFLWACLGGEVVGAFVISCGFLALAGAVYLLRALCSAWRPQRTTMLGWEFVFLLLVIIPSSLVSICPMRSAIIGLCAGVAFLAFLGFKEAFSAQKIGILSPRAFARLVAAGTVGVVVSRLAGHVAGATSAALPWYSLALEEGTHSQAFNHIFDFMLIVGFPVLLAVSRIQDGRRGKLLWRACVLFVGLGILLSFCRAAWVALAAELVLFALLDRSQRRTLWIAAGLALVMLLVVPGIRQRALSMVMGSETGTQRLEQWKAALVLIGQSPFLGHGLGSFAALYKERAYPCPHNLYLHVAVECGVPALCVFIAWVTKLLGGLWQKWKARGDAAPYAVAFTLAGLASIAGILAFGLFDL